MRILNSTKKWAEWWQKRKIDWDKSYLQTWNHPHRALTIGILKTFNWISLLEIGCGAGANLVSIVKNFEHKQIGGVDINADAIETARNTLKGAILKVGPGDDVMMSDKSADVILTDMFLIYVGPRQIHKYIKEIKRLSRSHVILCEFHEKSFWKRLWIRYNSGYFIYDYHKLLEKHGFYDIISYKIPKDLWPGGLQEKIGYIIKAKTPQR